MRSFCAIALPEEMRAALLRFQGELPGRPVAEENLHVTVVFLGDVSEEALGEMHLDLTGRALPACELAVTGLVSFGGRSPKLIAAAVERTPALAALHRAVQGTARAAGIDLPRERFRPHVTLLRFGHRIGAEDSRRMDEALGRLAGVTLPPMQAGALGLYSSRLTPEGPIYEELASYPLGDMT